MKNSTIYQFVKGMGQYVMKAELRERLAGAQHEIWAHWMKYQFRICGLNDDGSVTIPAASVERWTRQMNAAYGDLSEPERDSDRQVVDGFLGFVLEGE